MDNNAQLLVHAGASSTRQDDDQRVAQLAAYLDLESALASRKHIVWPPDNASGEILQERIPAISNSPRDDTSDGPDSITFIDDTQLAYTFLESQLFTSSARTVRATPTQRRADDVHVSSPASVPSKAVRLSESPILRPQSLVRESRIEYTHMETEGLFSTTEAAAVTEEQSHQSHFKEKTQTAEGTITSNDTTSELPNSYSLGNVSDSIHSRAQLSERSLSDPGPSPTKQHAIRSEPSPVLSQKELSRERHQQSLVTHSIHVIDQRPVTHIVGTAGDSVEDVVTKDLHHKVDCFPQNLSTSIDPAEPVTSIEPFTTHITPTLHKLASNPELAATFMPTAVERTLDVHERGHWEVQCPDWTSELQTSFWKTLETVVGTGKAGWGVRCTRGPEVSLCSQSSQQRGEPAEQTAQNSFGPVRVYCWGQIVEHMYLLLFVASNSKVRKLGLRWIDAQGLVVLQMRAG